MSERLNKRQREAVDEAVARLIALRRDLAADPERSHGLADQVLLDLLSTLHPWTAEVATEYEHLVKHSPWWAAA